MTRFTRAAATAFVLASAAARIVRAPATAPKPLERVFDERVYEGDAITLTARPGTVLVIDLPELQHRHGPVRLRIMTRPDVKR